MRRFMLCVLLGGLAAGLAGTLGASEVDPDVAAEARRLLAEMGQQSAPVVDDEVKASLRLLAESEMALAETRAWIDLGDAAAAGERFVMASRLLDKIPVEHRPRLEPRFGHVSAGLVDLARAFLESDFLPDELEKPDEKEASPPAVPAEPSTEPAPVSEAAE